MEMIYNVHMHGLCVLHFRIKIQRDVTNILIFNKYGTMIPKTLLMPWILLAVFQTSNLNDYYMLVPNKRLSCR